MTSPHSFIVFQTAFIGDAILALPMIQRLKRQYPESSIDCVAIPRTAEIFRSHPAVGNVIIYDKRNTDRGVRRIFGMAHRLAESSYDVALIPHRSFRSALIPALARIPVRVGFDKSAGAFLMTNIVPYRSDIHEIERNLSLLQEIGIPAAGRELPILIPDNDDSTFVQKILEDKGISSGSQLLAIAPGSVWATKRWLPDKYAGLVRMLYEKGFYTVLIGGTEDESLCKRVAHESGCNPLVVAGQLSLLQSAALLRRVKVLVTNDTAPMHLAVAVGTPVVAIFGATVPAFGFYPYGDSDSVVEITGLPCRPCSIHGGNTCPIKTFDCMKGISEKAVIDEVLKRI
jgi:heptosyltransferase II